VAKKPDPVAGLVIRYDYLWRDEHQAGLEQGAKDRPCAVVTAIAGGKSVLLSAITHSPPTADTGAIEIPPKVKQHLGLDAERSWIITGEINIATWDDPGIVPINKDKWSYGTLPPALAKMVTDQILEYAKNRQLAQVDRREIEPPTK
jgi:hypothetical protein